MGYFAIPRFFYIFAKNKYKTITMSKEELIEHYEILYAKKIKTLKSFKDGDFFKITSNNKIVKWGSFKDFKVNEYGVIISAHMYYDVENEGFEVIEGNFILQENSGAIEKMKPIELLVFMLKLREESFTFDRRNKMIIDNLTD